MTYSRSVLRKMVIASDNTLDNTAIEKLTDFLVGQIEVAGNHVVA